MRRVATADLWLWIPGSARYARGPGMTGVEQFITQYN